MSVMLDNTGSIPDNTGPMSDNTGPMPDNTGPMPDNTGKYRSDNKRKICRQTKIQNV